MFSRRWIGFVAVVAFVLALGWPARADNAVPDFAGLWAVQVTPDDATARAGKHEFRDTLFFEEDGSFSAEAFGPMGFAPAHADAGATDGSFTCTTENESQGTVVWSGTRTEDGVTGTMVWTKPDGTVCRYTFSGTRKS